MEQHDLLFNIGLVFTIATLFAFVAKALRQPLILAYLAAGAVIGPEIGFAWVEDKKTIELISEIGLILPTISFRCDGRSRHIALRPFEPSAGDFSGALLFRKRLAR